MTANLIDGKKIATDLRRQIGARVTAVKSTHNLTPGLAVVLVGEDPASKVYVRNKGIATKEVGMNSLEFRLPADTSQEALLDKVLEVLLRCITTAHPQTALFDGLVLGEPPSAGHVASSASTPTR